MLWPRLSVVFRRLVRLGVFPPCWRQANITPIPKGPPSSSVANYWPISISSVQYCLRCLSSWGLFVLDDLWNAMVCLQPPSLLIGKVWVPVMHFCACPIQVGQRNTDNTFGAFSILENKLIGYVMTTLMAVVPSPGVRVTVVESLIRDLGRVSCGATFGELNCMQVRPRLW